MDRVEINVVGCGSKVKVTPNKLDGSVIGICIEFDRITYKIGYFSSNDYKEVWLYRYEFEVLIEEEKSSLIGFKA